MVRPNGRFTRRRLLHSTVATAGALALTGLGAFPVSAAPLLAPAAAPAVVVAREPAPALASILTPYRLVTYYGNPYSAAMGILGALSKPQLVLALQGRANQYAVFGNKPVRPTIHMVVTTAQASPGPDGLYRARMPAALIAEYSDLAAANNMLFIADIQVGRSTVQAEVGAIESFLRQPQAHLALDPEFDMWGSQEPGVEIGHMTAAEINWALCFLGQIARSTGQRKILIVHQFTASMLPDKAKIGSDPNVDLAIVMDGWGGQAVKIRHYDVYVANSAIPYRGMKLFFDWDTNLMTPSQVLTLKPPPDIVIYQ